MALLAVTTGCANTTEAAQDVVLLQVKNITDGAVRISFEPQFGFEDGSPGSENMRHLDLAQGESKPLYLRRGTWRVESEPVDDIANPDGFKSSREAFLADGNLTIERALLRYKKTGPTKQPVRITKEVDDPIRLRGTSDFDDRPQ